MVLAHACTLTAVALLLTQLVGQKRNSVRQRLREFYQEADAKKGEHRRQLDVRPCFAPLTALAVA
jgi:heme exporter protein D